MEAKRCRLYIGHLGGKELMVKPTLKYKKGRFYFYKGYEPMINEKTMQIELRICEYGQPRSVLPGIEEEGP
jgi:hypothetical protein